MHRVHFIHRFSDRSYDPFVEEYTEHLLRLNEIIKTVGEPLEGNIFYNDKEEDIDVNDIDDLELTTPKVLKLQKNFLTKRRTFGLMSLTFNNVVEIGFNAGHSALILLTGNPNLKLTCIDICQHKYTLPCYEYLKSVFGNRINLINSNSALAFPMLARQQIDHDLFIIDGGHSADIAETDLFNVIQMGRKGSVICFDDSDYEVLRVILDMYVLSGKIIPLTDRLGFIENNTQMIFLNNKS
jgi:hypothetical protein